MKKIILSFLIAFNIFTFFSIYPATTKALCLPIPVPGFTRCPSMARWCTNPSTECQTCTAGSTTGVNSAIGCVPVGDENSFGVFLIRWALGIGGGIAFLLIVYAGFIIITSSGNPQRLQSGKELLTAAVSGLVLMIFAVFILRLFGRDILGIL